ncbi:hypothetical protein GQ53DRAFT_224123 [Thozetella sp. PMI_491]|nr:hypothetical protein GQ53DRAFT_224123 [Thozetella sp. PMI_491]
MQQLRSCDLRSASRSLWGRRRKRQAMGSLVGLGWVSRYHVGGCCVRVWVQWSGAQPNAAPNDCTCVRTWLSPIAKVRRWRRPRGKTHRCCSLRASSPPNLESRDPPMPFEDGGLF